MTRCGQIHVYGGAGWPNEEVPCTHEARWMLDDSPDWLVCDGCLEGLLAEEVVSKGDVKPLPKETP